MAIMRNLMDNEMETVFFRGCIKILLKNTTSMLKIRLGILYHTYLRNLGPGVGNFLKKAPSVPGTG